MTLLTSTAGVRPGLIPEEWLNELVVQPVQSESVALNPSVSRTVTTSGQLAHVPVVVDDVGAAWVAEGAEITPDDAEFTEITVTTSKLAALSVISRELADDSSPDALTLIGAGIARSIAAKVDEAMFSEPALSGVAPKGLGSITPTDVSSGSTLNSLDPFADAMSAAEQLGASLTSWVANPADVLTLAKLKQATGSQVPLLATDPTQPTRRVVQGLPLFPSRFVKQGSIWGMPSNLVVVARRTAMTLETTKDAYFSSDRIGIRATMRMGFAFPRQPAVIRVKKSGT